MTSLFSKLNIATAKQRGLNLNQFVMLVTPVERRPTKDTITHLFGESRKTVRCIHGSTLPLDKSEDLVTIHHTTLDRIQAKGVRTFSQAQQTIHTRLTIWSPQVSISEKVKSYFPKISKWVHKAENAILTRTPPTLI